MIISGRVFHSECYFAGADNCYRALPTYGRESIGGKASNSSHCNRTCWSNPTPTLLQASMLCRWKASVKPCLSVQGVWWWRAWAGQKIRLWSWIS